MMGTPNPDGKPDRRRYRKLAENAMLAAGYAVASLILPATPVANYRLTTALYVLASFDRALIPGLALGNALAGLPQGPVDILLGGAVGLLTAWISSLLRPALAPLAVLVVPTVVVPLWLSGLAGIPYAAVVPAVATGQALSAAIAWLVIVPVARNHYRNRRDGGKGGARRPGGDEEAPHRR